MILLGKIELLDLVFIATLFVRSSFLNVVLS